MIAQVDTEAKINNEVNAAKCPDCCTEFDIPCDVVEGEILSCSVCGLEVEVKKVNGGECLSLQQLTIEGEDWGE
jgi:hypothetical protein